MKRYDLIIVGAGPSGLSAAVEAAKRGLKVVVFDENEKPGGQLFKQIHKFFGSKSKFTRKSTCSEQNLSIHENAATYTCSNRDNDNIFFALCSTNPRFPKSRCIRIIKHFCRNMEFLLHHLSNRAVDRRFFHLRYVRYKVPSLPQPLRCLLGSCLQQPLP